MTDPSGLLAGFSDPQPFTPDTAAKAPTAPGVHVVLDRGAVIYVGSTGNLRRGLRQHLRGNRRSSVLHEQVGQLLDTREQTAPATEIAEWLAGYAVSWSETDNPAGAKDALVVATMPCFNRRIPKPRG
ncbi:MAG TPA: hypothetical protein VFX60_12610 [Micromonospora sp.]|nr:hypothetical protein [Micromonospora sp.]